MTSLRRGMTLAALVLGVSGMIAPTLIAQTQGLETPGASGSTAAVNALPSAPVAQTSPGGGEDGTGDEADGPTARSAVTVARLSIDGPIGPATADYVQRGLDEAQEDGHSAILLRIDTPGGLVTAMRDINDAILASPLPVLGFVAPTGARATSAGTYIMYATHIAAMAPGTTLGAATPVQMGGRVGGQPGNQVPGSQLPGTQLPGPGQPPADGEGGGDQGDGSGQGSNDREGDGQGEGAPSSQESLRAKQINDSAAYIRALANLRDRNADWAERAVREGISATAEEAAEANVITLIAGDAASLFRALDGRAVTVKDRDVTLALSGARVIDLERSWQNRLLGALSNPNVAFLFMLVGIYGIIFELANPGALAPGVIGAISLAIGLFSLNVLPVNWLGLVLLVLGMAFMVTEAFVPSFGMLGVGGLAAFALGASILFDTDVAAFSLSPWLIIATTAVTGLLLLVVVGYVIRSQRRRARTGQEGLTGKTATVDHWETATSGWVWLDGERWWAQLPPHGGVGEGRPAEGSRVRVTAAEGLTLTVEPA